MKTPKLFFEWQMNQHNHGSELRRIMNWEEEQWREALISDFKAIWQRLDLDRSAILLSLMLSAAAFFVAVLK